MTNRELQTATEASLKGKILYAWLIVSAFTAVIGALSLIVFGIAVLEYPSFVETPEGELLNSVSTCMVIGGVASVLCMFVYAIRFTGEKR